MQDNIEVHSEEEVLKVMQLVEMVELIIASYQKCAKLKIRFNTEGDLNKLCLMFINECGDEYERFTVGKTFYKIHIRPELKKESDKMKAALIRKKDDN